MHSLRCNNIELLCWFTEDLDCRWSQFEGFHGLGSTCPLTLIRLKIYNQVVDLMTVGVVMIYIQDRCDCFSNCVFLDVYNLSKFFSSEFYYFCAVVLSIIQICVTVMISLCFEIGFLLIMSRHGGTFLII